VIKTTHTTVKTCDRCKKVVQQLGTLKLNPVEPRDWDFRRETVFWGVSEFDKTVADLCDDCWDELMLFLGKEPSWWKKMLRPWEKETP
jgi:hypothetical protein